MKYISPYLSRFTGYRPGIFRNHTACFKYQPQRHYDYSNNLKEKVKNIGNDIKEGINEIGKNLSTLT